MRRPARRSASGWRPGLLVLAAWWAAIGSGGRSSFTPVAIGFAIAIGLAVVRRWRRRGRRSRVRTSPRPSSRRSTVDAADARDRTAADDLVLAVLGGAVFVVAVALLYGSTLTLSPRDGVQPIEFSDEAYYSVLGADLAETGTETIYSPSGFDRIDGLPTQTWYHWGELWLAAAVITIFGMAPLDARHFVVLPILLLAAAALTGTVVRRMTGSTSRGAFLFGFLACLFLAPVPLIRAVLQCVDVGLIFGITSYGAGGRRGPARPVRPDRARSAAGRPGRWPSSLAALRPLILPAHVVIALLGRRRRRQRLGDPDRGSRSSTPGVCPIVTPVWRRTFAATGRRPRRDGRRGDC